MARPKRLSDAQIRKALPALHGWRFSRGALRCEFKFESFSKALQFVVKVGGLAEAWGLRTALGLAILNPLAIFGLQLLIARRLR